MIKSSAPGGSFSARLKTSREDRDLSQSDLAKLAGMQPSAIAHFEADRRKPSFDNIRALAQALKVTADYLLGTTDLTATAFRDEAKLSDADRTHVQGIIDLMLKNKKPG